MIPAWVLVSSLGLCVLWFGGIYGGRKTDHLDIATPLLSLSMCLLGLLLIAAAVAWRLGVWHGPRTRGELTMPDTPTLPDGCRMSDPNAPWNDPDDDDTTPREPDYDENYDRAAEEDA